MDLIDSKEMAEWIVQQWDEQVSNRPDKNIHKKTLDSVWRQVYRHVSNGCELPETKVQRIAQ